MPDPEWSTDTAWTDRDVKTRARAHGGEERKRDAECVDLLDVKGIDIGTYVQMAQRAVNEAIAEGAVRLPSGYNIFWSGQYEYMLRAQQRLTIVIRLRCSSLS